MPTLEDTTEFQVSTLNDLLEADAKAVAIPSEGEARYRSWAFLSTAAAALLAILLVVSLVTHRGGGAGGGATAKAKDYPGNPVKQQVKLSTNVPTNVHVGDQVTLLKGSDTVAAPVFLAQVIKPDSKSFDQSPTVELAMTEEQGNAFLKAFPKGTEKGRIVLYVAPQAPATSATTAATTPPAPTPPASTPPPSTPPPSG
jgi:hypothetical protein